MRRVSLTVNGVRHELELEPRELLVYVLRERLGLTGTNVGCDTSSCGACTVLLDGESVKSCTVLGVQADGYEVTTIEGLADNGELHPIQQAFHEHHGSSAATARPAWSWRRQPARGEPGADRGRDPARARGQPLPLHRLPEHRRGRATRPPWRRGEDRWPLPRPVPAAVSSAPRSPRKEDTKLLTGQAQYVDNINLPGMVWLSVVRSPYAHATIKSVDVKAALELEGVVAAFSGADLAAEWAGLAAVRLARDRGHQDARRTCRSRRQGALRRRRRRGGRRRRAGRSRRTRRSSSRSTTSRCRAVTDVEAALDDGAPLVHDEFGTNQCYTWKLDAGEVEQAVRRGRGHGEGALPPAAADPERDRAARRARRTRCRRRASSRSGRRPRSRTSLRLTLAGVIGIPEAKLRVIAPDVGGGFGSKLERLRRGGALPRARAAARPPVKWIEERSRGLPRDDPRPRLDPGDRARRDGGGEDHGRPRAARLRRWAPTSSS